MAELEEIREAMADDLEIDFEKMTLWTRMRLSVFESGEEPPPPWRPDPYFMRKLDENDLGHLKEPLCVVQKLTVAGLVELIRTDRPKFLPTLQKEYGVAKLPERQKLRDIINEIANPPAGSEDFIRDQYKEELAIWPYAVVQGEKFIPSSDAECMVTAIPPSATQKYKVRVRDPKVTGIDLRSRRAENSGKPAGGTLPALENGEIVVGDEVSWSTEDPNLNVHIYVVNAAAPSMGYIQGWVHFNDLVPLNEDGSEKHIANPVSDYKIQRQIQEYFEEGYFQLSVIRAIKNGITNKPDNYTFRQWLDLIYMKVRGPALIKLGYYPNNKGLDEYMATVYTGDNYSHLSDEDYVLLTDAHNRIVQLMGGNDPGRIPDAMAQRKAGQTVDMASALANEGEPEPEAAPAEEPAAAPEAAEVS